MLTSATKRANLLTMLHNCCRSQSPALPAQLHRNTTVNVDFTVSEEFELLAVLSLHVISGCC